VHDAIYVGGLNEAEIDKYDGAHWGRLTSHGNIMKHSTNRRAKLFLLRHEKPPPLRKERKRELLSSDLRESRRKKTKGEPLTYIRSRLRRKQTIDTKHTLITKNPREIAHEIRTTRRRENPIIEKSLENLRKRCID